MSTNEPDSDDGDEQTEGAASGGAGGHDAGATHSAGRAEPPATAADPDAPSPAGSRGGDVGPPDEAEATPNAVLNAVIGGVVTAATTIFLGPFSPVVGGSVAGYLEGGETIDGLKVGAFSGLVALVPLLLFLPLLLFVVPVVGPRGGIAFLFAMVFGLSILGAYVVGLGALGGVLGAYLKRER